MNSNFKTLLQIVLKISVFTFILLIGPFYNIVSGASPIGVDWRNKSWESTGLAPDPEIHKSALVQVYAARAYDWRGAFAVHTWVAVKQKNAKKYTLLDVQVWRQKRGKSILKIYNGIPDRMWVGNIPEVLSTIEGDDAENAIPKILEAAKNYPFAKKYRVWPGPNSNTFTAHIGRTVPELKLNLPPTAIGKDYYSNGVVGVTPSGSGFQISLSGWLGVLVSEHEGLEFNFLGLNFGLNPQQLQLRLPGIGIVQF